MNARFAHPIYIRMYFEMLVVITDLLPLHVDYQLDVRVHDLEVRMTRMENVQEQMLVSLRRIEAQVQLQHQSRLQQSSYLHPYSHPPAHQMLHSPRYSPWHSQVGWSATESSVAESSSFLSPLPSSDPSRLVAPPTLSDSMLNPSPLCEPPVPSSMLSDAAHHRQPNVHQESYAEQDQHYPGTSSVSGPCRMTLRAAANPPLPSSEIPRNVLRSVEDVLAENIKLRTESLAGTLCQKLAKEAVFGKAVMKKCTPGGTREYPALPQVELYELKKIMFDQFPRFQTCPGAFEAVWKKCMVALEQACKRLRAFS